MQLGDLGSTLRWLSRHPLESALCGLITAMAVVTFSQVVARYVFQAPLSWSEELARFLLMWLSMLSAAYAFKIKAHFALRFVLKAFPPEIERYVLLGVSLVVAVFLAAFVYFSVVFVLGVEGHRAPALRIPMELPYSSAIVGGLLMLYYVLKHLWQDLVTPEPNPPETR